MTPTRLIITADDFGLTPATSEAILDAHRNGIVTRTSVLAVARDLDAQLASLDEAPDTSVNWLATRLAGALDRAGLEHTDRFRGLDEAGHWTAASLTRALQELAMSSSGSVEINTHPGAATDPDRVRFDWGYGWDGERRALTDPVVRDAITRLGFELSGS